MKRIAITGSEGFIGRNLTEYIRRNAPDLEAIPIARELFDDAAALAAELARCDVVFHLAGLSRSDDGDALYSTNMALARKIADAVMRFSHPVTVLLASTTHCKKTPYHCSKRDAEALFASLPAPVNGGAVLMPNTFGPGGKPYYNSVVATFCSQLAAHEEPQIFTDAPMALIFVAHLCAQLAGIFRQVPELPVTIPDQYHITVSELLARLKALDGGKTPQDALDNDLNTTLQFYRKDLQK